MSLALLDVRPESAFYLGHHSDAVNIPLEELQHRIHELPPRTTPLSITDAEAARAARAAEFLQTRGHATSIIALESLQLSQSGAAKARLWQPSPFLVEAMGRIALEQNQGIRKNLRALDVACGSGRDAVWLALKGYDVEAIDLLPDALQRAGDLARRSGVQMRLTVQDLERTPTLPERHYDIICVFRYLQRSLFPALQNALAPDGFMVYETFHESNLLTGQKPTNPQHLLKTGELAHAFANLQIRIGQDAVAREGRFFSHLLARRRG
jgi:tellurite methyltransferase